MTRVWFAHDDERSLRESPRRSSIHHAAGRPISQRIAALEASTQRPYWEVFDPNGIRRVRIGEQTDGTYGLRIWNNAGVLQVNQTYPA
jgi:hypothetical protein